MHDDSTSPLATDIASLSRLALPPRRSRFTGLYIHFPFCIQKCDYCDFFSLPLNGAREVGTAFLRQYGDALRTEFAGRKAAFDSSSGVNTIYFGGGTSSLMPADFIAELLEFFREEGFLSPEGDKSDEREITLEGNPENFTADYLADLGRIGITRVNSGIQTFGRRSLEAMNRYFDPDRYADVLARLDESPIPHVGADLIYGLPGQSEDDFYADLERLLATRIDHLSLYSLTAEAGTAYARRVDAGEPSPDDELQARIMAALPAHLSERGFHQYEISNFARPGASCRHNLRYWYYETYMGLGPGAHGFDGRLRYGNARNLEKWLADPLHAGPTAHDPTADVALNLLRLTTPIPDDLVREIFTGMTELPPATRDTLATTFLQQLQHFADQHHAYRTESGTFQWTQPGLLHLDDHIYTITEALEQAIAQ